MKRSLLLLAFMAVAFTSSVYAQTSAQIAEEWQRAKAYTKEYLDAMPTDGYAFKPTPEMRSFATQMLHIADATYYFIATASGKASPIGKTSLEKTVTPTKEAVTKAVMDSYDFAVTSIQGITPAQMLEVAKAGPKELPKSGSVSV